jgi:hypothetical protein
MVHPPSSAAIGGALDHMKPLPFDRGSAESSQQETQPSPLLLILISNADGGEAVTDITADFQEP